MSGSVRTTLHAGVLEVVIDHPARRNALDTTVQAGLVAALEQGCEDPQVGAVLLAGRGPTFASGADIDELSGLTPGALLTRARRRLWDLLGEVPVPVVAAVRGHVLGGGCELALASDLIVAGDDAVLGQPELRLALLPGAGGSQRWTRAVGRYRAAAVVLNDRWVDAWEAQRWGLVDEVVPPHRVVAVARRTAVSLAAGPRAATAAGKRTLDAALELGLRAGLEHDRLAFATQLASEEASAGIAAFVARRQGRAPGGDS